MASPLPTPSAAVRNEAPSSGGRLTPTVVAIFAMLVLCALQLLFHLYDANEQAEVEARAALVLIDHQVESQGAASLKQPSALLLAAVKPREAVLALAHCGSTHCDLIYARPGGAVCSGLISWPAVCASVMSPALAGQTVRLSYDLQPTLASAATDMGATVLLCGAVLLLWRGATSGLRRENVESGIAVQQASEHDPLTGLLNRVAFEATLKRHNEAKGSAATSTDGCLMYFDLDRFKIINDTYGHLVGDEVLKTVAKRLRYTLGSDVPIGRLGGDEFAVLLADVASKATIEQMGRVVIEQVSKPIQVNALKDSVGLSIGAYMMTRGALNVGDMLHRADLAMYEAKKSGRGRLVFFVDSMDEASRSRAQMQVDLRKALEERQMFMVYQAQVDSHDSIRGVESMVRWRHPTKGVLRDDDFIPLAEQSGLIIPLGKLVIELVCADLVALRAQRLVLPYVSVNLSLKQLADETFVDEVLATLKRHALSTTDIEFEITEGTAMVGRSDKENATLNKLSAMGFRIAIDNFGTGYSSLGRLLDLKVDKLKFDAVFVKAIGTPRFDPVLLELMISLAGRLGVKSVAEGVETPAQVKWLREAGCKMMQGNLFAQPMNHGQLVSWLKLQEGDRDFGDGVWAPTQTMDEIPELHA
jgi:diguanylate cyclase (GGDEF)-like protein